MKKKVVIILSIFVVIALLGIGITYAYFENLHTINSEDTYFIIKKEAALEDVSKQLQDKAIIKSKAAFLAYVKFNTFSKSIKPSNLIVKPNISYKELLSKLQNAQSDFSIVTIPEGFTLYQISERLEKYTSIKKENLLKINIIDINKNNLMTNNPDAFYNLEGFLFPDTYYIPTQAKEKEIANLMFNRFKSVFTDKYINRAKELGLTINQFITIASLIEREAANDSERSRIAGVIYNRIAKGMPLQIDAAVIYAITKGQSTIQKVTYNDLKIQNKYNTYLYKGLPPGPIASPGKPSIEAALYPEKNDYLYYVLNGNGHVFSKTYAEHLSNVKKYIK